MIITQALEVVKQPEISAKRSKEEGAYTTETNSETKFKLIYNKRLIFSSIGKEKVIDIEDTNAPEVNNDEATVIVNEILAEIEKDKTASKDDTQMIEKQNNMEASSSQTAEEKDLDIKEKYKQIKQKNEEIKSEKYSQFLKKKPWSKNRLLTTFDYISP